MKIFFASIFLCLTFTFVQGQTVQEMVINPPATTLDKKITKLEKKKTDAEEELKELRTKFTDEYLLVKETKTKLTFLVNNSAMKTKNQYRLRNWKEDNRGLSSNVEV